MFRTRAAVLLATASLRAHRVADAREAIAKARSVWSTSGERWWSPEIDRLEGELLALGDGAERLRARTLLEAALANARRDGLVLFAERAVASLARVHAESPPEPEAAHG
ncbi:MAG: hypothetical protein IAI48_04705 [Candidatus Eremiobacteraeota bacterium]|nr:hypothetical protein [Candidatus Eremiobacteraeota bacterium]